MKQIELSQGLFAMVDDEDYDELMKYKWFASVQRKTTYAYRNGDTWERSSIIMHRQIMNLTDQNLTVDHIDHNGLNNQKSNLRVCTRSENSLNKNSHAGSASKYIGVYSFNSIGRKAKWRSSITINKRTIRLGYFKTEIEAAKARDEFIITNGIQYAKLNFPKQ